MKNHVVGDFISETEQKYLEGVELTAFKHFTSKNSDLMTAPRMKDNLNVVTLLTNLYIFYLKMQNTYISNISNWPFCKKKANVRISDFKRPNLKTNSALPPIVLN